MVSKRLVLSRPTMDNVRGDLQEMENEESSTMGAFAGYESVEFYSERNTVFRCPNCTRIHRDTYGRERAEYPEFSSGGQVLGCYHAGIRFPFCPETTGVLGHGDGQRVF